MAKISHGKALVENTTIFDKVPWTPHGSHSDAMAYHVIASDQP